MTPALNLSTKCPSPGSGTIKLESFVFGKNPGHMAIVISWLRQSGSQVEQRGLFAEAFKNAKGSKSLP